MQIALAVQMLDTEKPTAVINPFYWNSNSDNSLFNNSTANGHIELEGDLPEAFTDGNTDKEMDRDPKVSGKIVVRGTASDNIRLKELYVQFTDHSGITTESLHQIRQMIKLPY